MKLQSLLMFGLLAAGATALAQEQPNSAQYHAVHNPNSPNYVGPNQQPAAPQPTGYWEKTWGAIAADGEKGILGTFTGASSRQQAESQALMECQQKGGSCKVFAYHNQCTVLVSGDNHYVTQSAENVEVASKIGLGDCQKSDTGCRVHYSACTEPIFHKY